MTHRSQTCCFTGHRSSSFPWQCASSDPHQTALLHALGAAIDNAIEAGYAHFIAGNALGVDTWSAALVLERKLRYPKISLEVALPFPGHNGKIRGEDGELLAYIHKNADSITVVTEGLSHKEAFYHRNRYMVDQSSMLIAVYDERSGRTGGTLNTFRYAQQQGLKIQQILWMDL